MRLTLADEGNAWQTPTIEPKALDVGTDQSIAILVAIAALFAVIFGVSFLPAFPKLPQIVHQVLALGSAGIALGCIGAAVFVGFRAGTHDLSSNALADANSTLNGAPAQSDQNSQERLYQTSESTVRDILFPAIPGPLLPYFIRDIKGHSPIMTTYFSVRFNFPADQLQSESVPYRIYFDLPNNAYFDAIYLPSQKYGGEPFYLLKTIAPNVVKLIDERARIFTVGTAAPGGGTYDSSHIRFTGRLFIYMEDPITSDEAAKIRLIFDKYNADVEIRGPGYLAARQSSNDVH